jgi:hypothetical protein
MHVKQLLCFFFTVTFVLGLIINIKPTLLVASVKGGATISLAMSTLSVAHLCILPLHTPEGSSQVLLFGISTTTSRSISIYVKSGPKTDNLREDVRK